MATTDRLNTGTTREAGGQSQTSPPPPVITDVSESPASEEQLTLSIPPAGQTLTVSVKPGQTILVDFDVQSQTLTVTEGNLLIEFNNDASILLQDFALYAAGDTPPMLAMADGSIMAGDSLVFAFGGTQIEPAAGPELASGGAGEYRDDLGDLIEGIDRLGTLDPDSLPLPAEQVLEDEEVNAIEAVPAEPPVEPPVEPPNGPPLAVDDVVAANITEAIAVNTKGPNAGIYRLDLSGPGGDGYQLMFNPGRPLDDLAFDGDGTLWGVGSSIDKLDLFTIDLLTQTVTSVATIEGITGKVDGIVFIGNDLYALSKDTLYSIDTESGEATVMADDLGFQASTDLVALEGNLYFVSTSGHLIELEPDGDVNDLGKLDLAPGAYGIVPAVVDGNGVLYLVSNKEVLVVDPLEGGFAETDRYDLAIPLGEGQFKGLAGTLAIDDDGVYTGNVLSNDTDTDGDPLTVVTVNDADENLAVPDGGSVTLTGEFGTLELFSDGFYEYTLTSEEPGIDVFTYTISDGEFTDSAELTFNVNSIFEQNLLFGGEEGGALAGTAEADLILGGEGADQLFGNDGDDFLFGGEGDDELEGGAGADYLAGGADSDILTGGEGTDTFVFSAQGGGGSDTISDFESGIDGDVLKIVDVLDSDSSGDITLTDVDATVSDDGTDVTLTLNAGGPPPQQTVVVIENIGNSTIDSLEDLASVINIEIEEGVA